MLRKYDGAQDLFLVRSSAAFKDWGVVDISNGIKCLTCHSHRSHCKHARVVAGDLGLDRSTARLSPADFEKKLGQDLDFETGQRKLKCISRATIPRQNSDPALDKICSGGIVKLDGHKVELWSLYNSVLKHGGFQKVIYGKNSEKLRKAVAGELKVKITNRW